MPRIFQKYLHLIELDSNVRNVALAPTSGSRCMFLARKIESNLPLHVKIPTNNSRSSLCVNLSRSSLANSITMNYVSLGLLASRIGRNGRGRRTYIHKTMTVRRRDVVVRRLTKRRSFVGERRAVRVRIERSGRFHGRSDTGASKERRNNTSNVADYRRRWLFNFQTAKGRGT